MSLQPGCKVHLQSSTPNTDAFRFLHSRTALKKLGTSHLAVGVWYGAVALVGDKEARRVAAKEVGKAVDDKCWNPKDVLKDFPEAIEMKMFISSPLLVWQNRTSLFPGRMA